MKLKTKVRDGRVFNHNIPIPKVRPGKPASQSGSSLVVTDPFTGRTRAWVPPGPAN